MESKRWKKMTKYLLFLLLFINSAFADDVTLRFGLEPLIKGEASLSDVKVLMLGYAREFKPNVMWRLEAGYS